jgi:hypothetical protein
MSKAFASIHMKEENLHQLILIAGEMTYRACKAGQSWDAIRIELIDALVAVTRPMEQEEAEELGIQL